MLRRFLNRQKGQGLVEYSLILMFIAIVVIVTLVLIGPHVRDIFGLVYNSFNTTPP